VGSLLEVGTGFHPELTGRENIYLNGAILGMRKQEIDRKFDEIVAFAEVERFLDTPVKRYSSGMRVRLGFAVAAHLDPEILIVDEVLSVGDAAFRKRCLGKMDTVARGGRTVLFVSHNMAAVQNLCSRAILLVDGRQEVNGTPENVIAAYLEKTEEWADQEGGYFVNRDLLQSQARKDIRFTDIQILDEIGSLAKTVRTGQKLVVRMHYETTDRIASPAFGVMLETDYGQEVFRLTTTPISGFLIDNLGKKGSVDLTIDWLPLTAGRCRLSVLFLHRGGQPYIHLDQVIIFDVQPCDVYNSGLALERNRGLIVLPHSWRHQILEAPLEEPC
ncbi:ABC transporter ATP-binding protein, partial [bacterium]|nr:ABC transporter ATP-binding protein [bacterium]